MSQSEHANMTLSLSRFPNLKMIYLHGNKISSLEDLSRLKLLPNLYSLTLHGNPLENSTNYRSSVLRMLPYLRSLDFAKGEDILESDFAFHNFHTFSVTDGEREVKPRSRSRKQKKSSL